MAFISMTALVIFVAVVTVDVLVLLFDAFLKWGLKVPTISRRVWQHPSWSIPLVLWQFLGGAGLMIHLLVPC